jgi:hypothetical protein
MNKKYCGLNDPPKGQERGTAAECLSKNQVRHWGRVKIDDKTWKDHDIKKIKDKEESNLNKEKAKLMGMSKKGSLLLSKIRDQNDIIKHPRTTREEKDNAKKLKKKYLDERVVLKKQFEDLKKKLLTIEEKIEKENKAKARAKKNKKGKKETSESDSEDDSESEESESEESESEESESEKKIKKKKKPAAATTKKKLAVKNTKVKAATKTKAKPKPKTTKKK